MVRQPSTMVALGTKAPPFELEDHNARSERGTVSLDDAMGEKGLLVMFLCQHCPFVKHLEDRLGELTRQYMDQGLGVVAICSNDLDAYPQDGPKGIAGQVERAGFDFPYLIDEDQSVALAYRAACTPDLFLFDADGALVYRGQFDETRPGRGEPTGKDLDRAVQALLAGEPVPEDQVPSVGCNIKWREENTPEYFQR